MPKGSLLRSKNYFDYLKHRKAKNSGKKSFLEKKHFLQKSRTLPKNQTAEL